MNGSVTSTERLKLRSRPGSRLAATNSSMSGWSQRMVAIIAPRLAPGGHDGAAHRVPDIHERERAGGIGAHAPDGSAPRPQGGEVIADAAALLHRQRRLAKMGEDGA